MNSGTSIGYTVRVITPANAAEVYTSPTGLVQWHEGLPIPVQDTIQITAAVAAGAEPIKVITATLDGKAIPPVTVAPWSVTVGGGTLSLGDHLLQINTTVTDKHNAVAKFPMAFTTVQALPNDLQPSAPVTSSVQGTQQILSNGKVASVVPTASVVAPPVLGASAKQIADSGVDVSFVDTDAAKQLKSGDPVLVNGSLTATITPSEGSPATQFVFAIYRDGAQVYKSSDINPIVGAHIKLQAQSGDTPGLLPGLVQLYVWGISPSGDYTAPTVVTFSMNDAPAPTQSKL